MRLVLALVVPFTLALSPLAHASSSASPAPDIAPTQIQAATGSGDPQVTIGDQTYSISTDYLMAVGVGVVGGTLVLHSVLGVPQAVALIAGGLAGHWWYNSNQADAGGASSIQYRAPSRFLMEHPDASPLTQVRWLGESPN